MAHTITCIGIDLAWSPRNPTGAATIVGDEAGGTLVETALLGGDQEIIAYVERHAGDGLALVAVDAPLWVPNQTGRRPAEAELGRAFGRYQAGAHPANRERLTFDGAVRGEALVAALRTRGFVYRPAIEAGVPVRQVVEVYPHPATIALFGLERTLKYKARPGRSMEQRLAAWRQFQANLRGLAAADPPLRGHEELLGRDASTLRGRRLKDYEDQVDALLCAYIALYAFRWGAARCQTFGSLEHGSIFTPVPAQYVRLAVDERFFIYSEPTITNSSSKRHMIVAKKDVWLAGARTAFSKGLPAKSVRLMIHVCWRVDCLAHIRTPLRRHHVFGAIGRPGHVARHAGRSHR